MTQTTPTQRQVVNIIWPTCEQNFEVSICSHSRYFRGTKNLKMDHVM